MTIRPPNNRNRLRVISVVAFVLLAVLVFIGIKARHERLQLKDALNNAILTNQVLSDLKVELLKSVEAEKSAVLADTDEASKDFADQSMKASAAVDEGRTKLHRLVDEGGISEELKLSGEFDHCWAELQKIDRVLLELAVQNTNIKAAKLSETEGSQAMKQFEKAIGEIVEAGPSDTAETRTTQLAMEALSSAHEVQVLQLPHILASSDERMDRIEADMRKAADRTNRSLEALQGLANEKSKATLAEAKNAFAEFMRINARIIELSRQNTNIKSMELSLGKKRVATAQCEEVLSALQKTVANREFKATR